ncbi:MAG: hypothetical protein IT210_01085 [Armatimonadetes bacterium]|nr:hypothetical protein [Armatimonadota bacterium]
MPGTGFPACLRPMKRLLAMMAASGMIGAMSARSPMWAIVLGASGLYAVAAARRPFIDVWLLLGLAPLDALRLTLLPSSGAVLRGAQVIAVIACARRWGGSASLRMAHPLLWPAAALWGLQAVGLLRTPCLADGLRQLCILPAYAVVTAAASGPGDWRLKCRLYGWVGIGVAAHGLLQFAGRWMGLETGAFQTLGGLPRPRAAFVEADWLGLYLLSVAPFLICLLMEADTAGQRLSGIGGMALALVVLGLTQVRTAWLLLIPALALQGMLCRRDPRLARPAVALLLMPACLLAGAALWGPGRLPAMTERLRKSLDRTESSANWRIETGRAVIEHVSRSPWIGAGPGSVKAVLDGKIAALTQQRGGSVGGLFTTVAFESGLPGLFALLWAAAALIRAVKDRWRRASPAGRTWLSAISASLSGLGLAALLFDIRYLMPFWVLLGLATAETELKE